MGMELYNDLRSAIWAFYEAQCEVVFSRIKIGPGGDQEEAVHEMRVAAKKIRTVFRLVEFIAPERFDSREEIKGLRRLFRSGALLREMQVNEQVISDYEGLQVKLYRRLSQLLLNEARAAMPGYEVERKAFEKKSLTGPGKKVKEILDDVSEEELVLKTEEFCGLRFRQVLESMPPNYDAEGIHKTRIFLKEAMYLISILQATGHPWANPERLQAAKAAAEVAGDWHDREVFYHWLVERLQVGGSLAGKVKDYDFLIGDLKAHTRSMVTEYRKRVKQLIMNN
ncbi:MAG: CHAD domain-containing protein [Bacteroidia bacterium]